MITDALVEHRHLHRLKTVIARFVRLHGDRRITRKARLWLKKVTAQQLRQPGNLLLLCHTESRLIGVLAAGDHGREVMMIAVHRKHRSRHVGQQLLSRALSQLERMHARVALDNVPSIALFFASGWHAHGLKKGATGKPTLLFAGERRKQMNEERVRNGKGSDCRFN